MKAAIIFQKGEMPQYTEFPEPVVKNEEEILISVKAAAIKHLDKSKASGKHYSTKNDIHNAKVIGGDGVGLLEDGTRVFALGVSGMIAEKAIIEKSRMIKLPAGIDEATAGKYETRRNCFNKWSNWLYRKNSCTDRKTLWR
jgi:NADPH:quinone reductase-like Zn-dependent oxidoreductase